MINIVFNVVINVMVLAQVGRFPKYLYQVAASRVALFRVQLAGGPVVRETRKALHLLVSGSMCQGLHQLAILAMSVCKELASGLPQM